MGFTVAELAEMARADAEIEATFRWTADDIKFSRALDREAILGGMDSKHRARAEAQRRWYAAHKEEAAEGKRRYRAAHKEEVAEAQRRWYAAHKEEVAEAQRRWYAAHKEEVAEGKRALRSLRQSLGLSQQQFARQMGVTQSAVSHWELISAPGNWKDIVQKYEKEGQAVC